MWRQYVAPPEVLRCFEERLGDHWLGMENGEQDGRYVGGYAAQMTPRGASREEQYLNFQRHFEKHGDEVGNRMTILVSLNFSHYFAKEGVYSLNGAETGQALPNGQVYYASRGSATPRCSIAGGTRVTGRCRRAGSAWRATSARPRGRA
jgi:hypothetical protein